MTKIAGYFFFFLVQDRETSINLATLSSKLTNTTSKHPRNQTSYVFHDTLFTKNQNPIKKLTRTTNSMNSNPFPLSFTLMQEEKTVSVTLSIATAKKFMYLKHKIRRLKLCSNHIV